MKYKSNSRNMDFILISLNRICLNFFNFLRVGGFKDSVLTRLKIEFSFSSCLCSHLLIEKCVAFKLRTNGYKKIQLMKTWTVTEALNIVNQPWRYFKDFFSPCHCFHIFLVKFYSAYLRIKDRLFVLFSWKHSKNFQRCHPRNFCHICNYKVDSRETVVREFTLVVASNVLRLALLLKTAL